MAAVRVLVTGAGGFIGRRLVSALLSHPAFADARFALNDLRLVDAPDDSRLTAIEGDFADPTLLVDQPTHVFHLAGILGGAAEADYGLARRVNLDATLALIEGLRTADAAPRLVFASSIAVFGPPLPPQIDDETLPLPVMTYGAQKRMIEVAIEQFAARSWVDGIALRLPGIVARPDADARLKSAFLNRLFHAVAAGEDIELPVSPGATTWLISAPACVDALLHAALLPRAALGARRAMTLPAQRVTFAELVAALKAYFPDSPFRIRYAPDEGIEAQFGRSPLLATALADGLGFRHDGDVDTLVHRALEP